MRLSFMKMDLNYIHPMKTFRIVLSVLAMIPLALLTDKLFFRPESYVR
jgi:hypothetical protein